MKTTVRNRAASCTQRWDVAATRSNRITMRTKGDEYHNHGVLRSVRNLTAMRTQRQRIVAATRTQIAMRTKGGENHKQGIRGSGIATDTTLQGQHVHDVAQTARAKTPTVQ